jgi:hypothetical protein
MMKTLERWREVLRRVVGLYTISSADLVDDHESIGDSQERPAFVSFFDAFTWRGNKLKHTVAWNGFLGSSAYYERLCNTPHHTASPFDVLDKSLATVS